MFSNPIRKDNYGYLFIAPFLIIFFLLFHIYPILYSFYLSFTNWDGISAPEFVGLDNYLRSFTDSIFYQSLYNTFVIWVPSVIPQLTVSLVLAVILNEKFLKGKDFFSFCLFLSAYCNRRFAGIAGQFNVRLAVGKRQPHADEFRNFKRAYRLEE